MLCRVADSLFWMSRYFERAENMSRLVEVNLQLLLESRQSGNDQGADHWAPVLHAIGDWELYHSLYDKYDSATATDFLTFNPRNPSSALACIHAARENARVVRDQISPEMWEVINRLYLLLRESNSRSVLRRGTDEFFQTIKEYSHLFQGVTEATFLRRVGYEFIIAGRFLERADKTSRFLDLKEYLDGSFEPGGIVDTHRWLAILRACSALEAYHQAYVADVEPRSVVEFILQSRHFPRAVYFCLSQVQTAIHHISGCPITHYSNEAERLCGRLLSDLNYRSLNETLAEGLHSHLQRIQREIGNIVVELANKYMYYPIVDPAADLVTSPRPSTNPRQSQALAGMSQSQG